MPIVDIKGVGKAQFPDGMSVDDIRAFLQRKYAQQAISGQSDILSPQPDTVAPYNPSLVDKIGGGIANTLTKSGLISDNYRAQQIGKNLSSIGEFLPGVGDATAGDEFGRAAAKGDKLGMGLSALGVIPVAGDLAKKGIKALKPHQVSPTSKEWSDFDIDDLHREAFGVAEPDVKRLKPSELNIKWTDDIENVEYEIKNSGKTRKGWAKDIDLSEPIDVILEDGIYKIDDGHHRYTAAKILGKDLPVDLRINDQPFVGLAKRATERGEEVHPDIMKAAVDRGFKPTKQSLPMGEVRQVTSYNDMFDFTPEQMAQQLRSSKPENVIDGVYIEQTTFGEKRFNPDGSVEIVKGGKVLRKIEPQDADMAYKNKIMKNEGEKPEVKAAQEKRRAEFDAERIKQQAQEAESYKMQHTAPTREDNPSGDDLTDTFGSDIYTGNALRYFGTGASYDNKAIRIIQGMKGKPEKAVTIYRAVPKSVKSINSSDWVTTTKEYAQAHGPGCKQRG